MMSSSSKRPENVVLSEGLPRQFLSSLRILFDILDENRSGYVRLQDIESRWSDDGVRGLPQGVVDGLRKVTPPNGLLSFEKFVSGLKLVLATKKREPNEPSARRLFSSVKENREPHYEVDNLRSTKSLDNTNTVNGGRPVSDGRFLPKDQDGPSVRSYTGQNILKPPPEGNKFISDYDRKQNYGGYRNGPQTYSPPYGSNSNRGGGNLPRQRSASSNAYVIKPDVSAYPNKASQNAPSKPSNPYSSQSGGAGALPSYTGHASSSSNNQAGYNPLPDKAPAIPPRQDRSSVSRSNMYGQEMKKSKSGPDLHSYSPPVVPPRDRRAQSHILNELKSWQQEWSGSKAPVAESGWKGSQTNKKPDAIYANIEDFQKKSEDGHHHPQQHPQQQQQQSGGQGVTGPGKATVRRHGSGRRHTLANGIDHNMLRRMKQLEEETSILRSGLAVTECARDWYRKQLAAVSDKQAMLGKVSYNDNSVEAYQERMNFQRTRIAEVNQHLRTLIESSEKGFPLHMNLAVANPSVRHQTDGGAMRAVREQNRRLVDEMQQKKEHIAQIEKEKASLVKELFEARSKNQQQNYDDTTFM